MQYFRKILQLTSRLSVGIGIIFTLAIGFTTALNVVLRFFFNIAMTGFMEAIEVMMIVAVLGAMTGAAFEKAQVAIDMLLNYMSPRKKATLEVVSMFASLVFWGSILWATIDWIVRGAFKEQTDVLKIHMLPFEIYWVFGLFFFCMVCLGDLLTVLQRRLKK
jgi:TRAP-type C4-dicarboxylate transport system permease small subunit